MTSAPGSPPPPADAPVEQAALRARALRGSVFAIGHYVVSNLLRFGSNLLLAHVLFPEAFAVVAISSILLQGLQMFSDIGIGPAIVQHPRGDEPLFLNTAFTLQALRGFALFLVALALAWPMASFYGEPLLRWILPVSALSFIIGGFWATSPSTSSRRLELGAVTLLGFGESIVKTAITVVWALIWPSVWVLVGASLITMVLSCIATHALLPGVRNRFAWDPAAARDLVRFGRWVFVSTVVTFLAQQSDRLLLGKLAPMGVLGVYSIAYMLARLPTDIGSRLSAWVLFPALAEVYRRDPTKLAAKLRETRGLVLAVSQFGVVGVMIVSPWFFRLLYDARYGEAAVFAPLIAATTWFSLLQASADRVLLVVADARSLAASNFANLTLTIFGCVAGFAVAGMPGFIAGVGLGNLIGEAVVVRALARHGVPILRQDLAFTALIGAIAAFSCALPRWLAPDLIWLHVALGSAGLAASAGIAIKYVLPLVRRFLRERRARAEADRAPSPGV